METLRLSPFSINLELKNIQSFPSCVTRKVEKSTTNRSARHLLIRKVYNLSADSLGKAIVRAFSKL